MEHLHFYIPTRHARSHRALPLVEKRGSVASIRRPILFPEPGSLFRVPKDGQVRELLVSGEEVSPESMG